MNFDKENGSLILPEIDGVISFKLTRSECLKLPAFSKSLISVRNDPWCSYLLPEIKQVETTVTITLQFHGEQLLSFSICHGAPQFGCSWSDWSEEKELARKKYHENWLYNQNLAPELYPWGEVGSYYDSKGGSCYIMISYAEQAASPNHAPTSRDR